MAINMTKAFYTHKCNETTPKLALKFAFTWKLFELNNHFNHPDTLEGIEIDFAHLFAWWPPICAHVTHDRVCSMCARVPISILPHYPCQWSRNVTRALWAGKLWWPLAWWPVVTRRWPGLWSPWSAVFSPPPHTIGCPMARVPTLLTSPATL